jgi:hypothetical protein
MLGSVWLVDWFDCYATKLGVLRKAAGILSGNCWYFFRKAAGIFSGKLLIFFQAS